MRDNASGGKQAASTCSEGNDTPGVRGANTGPEPGTATTGKRVLAGFFVAAVAAFTAVGFGAAIVIRDQLAPAASAAIPVPPAKNQTFAEDNEGTGADSQANIVQSTVPGLLRVTSTQGTGTGVVLTASGLVLTSAQVAGGRGPVTARILPSAIGASPG